MALSVARLAAQRAVAEVPRAPAGSQADTQPSRSAIQQTTAEAT